MISLVLIFMAVWMGSLAWQLWLANTKGKIWARTKYVTRESNEASFDGNVAMCWVMLGFGAVMTFAMLIVAIKELISS